MAEILVKQRKNWSFWKSGVFRLFHYDVKEYGMSTKHKQQQCPWQCLKMLQTLGPVKKGRSNVSSYLISPLKIRFYSLPGSIKAPLNFHLVLTFIQRCIYSCLLLVLHIHFSSCFPHTKLSKLPNQLTFSRHSQSPSMMTKKTQFRTIQKKTQTQSGHQRGQEMKRTIYRVEATKRKLFVCAQKEAKMELKHFNAIMSVPTWKAALVRKGSFIAAFYHPFFYCYWFIWCEGGLEWNGI